MAPRDRTNEFHATLASIRSRSTGPIAPKPYSLSSKPQDAALQERLLPNGGGHSGSKTGKQPAAKSEFARMAGQIGRDINATTIKLQKLAQLAKRKTLFDDRPVEISELTYIIRQDIQSLNQQISDLQSFVKTQKAGGASSSSKQRVGSGQVDEHNNNVVMMLQSRLASMGMGFKDVLELRTQNMKASKDRTEQFMHSTAGAAVPPPPSNSLLYGGKTAPASGGGNGGNVGGSIPGLAPTSALLQPIDRKGKGRALQDSSDTRSSSDYLALDMNGDGGESGTGSGYQQMQLVEQQDSYIQSRSTAIESIESTIAELGQIFTQLAGMVAEQRETVQRIDADTTDIASNVSGAQRELLKYYASVTSNRWLMLKIFGVLIIFFLVFILVS